MAGFVYIMSNPLFTRIKIGKSTKDPTIDRLNELNRETGTPEKYKCEYYAFVGDENGLERAAHRLFSNNRPNSKREFFEISISEAIQAIRATATDFGGIKHEEVFYKDFQILDNLAINDEELTENAILRHAENLGNDGSKYSGDWKNGEYHGHGTLTKADGDKYTGNWENGKRNGQGQMISNGRVYVGNWKDDNWHGHGTLTYGHGAEFVDGWRHPFGDKYTGNWEDGRLNGHGEFTNRFGFHYVGSWKHGVEHGHGTMNYGEGESQYTGEWENGDYHGNGKETFFGGTYYNGEWKYGMRNGYGIETFDDGSKYAGNWEDEEYHGQGTLTLADGTQYVGQFKYGVFQDV